jgi:steroid delta-isomerase
MTVDARRTAETYLDAFSAMDEEGWIAVIAPDAVSNDPVGAPELRGHDAFRRFFRGICAAFDQLELTPDSVFVQDDTVAVKWTGRGSGRNGRAVTFEGIHVFVVDRSGLISRLWGFWEPGHLAAELQAV